MTQSGAHGLYRCIEQEPLWTSNVIQPRCRSRPTINYSPGVGFLFLGQTDRQMAQPRVNRAAVLLLVWD